MLDCIFCKIVRKEIPAEIVYETEHWLAFLDIKPVNPGHTLLVPKTHFENLFDLPAERLAEFGGVAQKLARAVKMATNAAGLNLGMNNGRSAGQLIDHAHLHLIPRFENDGHRHWHGQTTPTKNELMEMKEKILAVLSE
ncbi:MAG: HIT family protein [Patescibacteria group bacterium]